MRKAQLIRTCLLLDLLIATMMATPGYGQAGSAKAKAATEQHDGQHDFDFEFGSWKAHLKRLVHPLSGSNDWVEYDGISTVRKIWDGAGNLGEFDASGKNGQIQGMSLRLYNPESKQWSIYWGNRKDGSLSMPAMVGGFDKGRGEFYDQEMFNGKAVYVRFIFSDIKQDTFELEQAFSPDGGKTWEPNWVVTFTRQN